MINKNYSKNIYKLLLIVTFGMASYYIDLKNNTDLIYSLLPIYFSLLFINKVFESIYILISSKISNLSLNYIIFKFFILYKSNNSWHIKKKISNSLHLANKYKFQIPLCNSNTSLVKLRKSINIMSLSFLIISSIIPLLYFITISQHTNKISFLIPSLFCLILNLNYVCSYSNKGVRLFDNYINLLAIATTSTIKNNKFSCYSSNELLNRCNNLYECKDEKEVFNQLLINENILALNLHNLVEAIPSCFYDNIGYLLTNTNKFLSADYANNSFRLYYLICIYLHKVEKKTYEAIALFSYINSMSYCDNSNDILLKNTVAYILGFKHNLENLLDSYLFDLVDNKNKERVYIENLRTDLICSLV